MSASRSLAMSTTRLKLRRTLAFWMVLIAVVFTLQGTTGLIWFGLVGWFIAWLAGASYRQQEVRSRLSGLTVERIMTPHPEYVDGELSVEDFVHDHLLGRQHSRYPVIDAGVIVGIVSLAAVKTIARTEWPYVKVVDITQKDLSKLSVDASTPVHQALNRLAADEPGALLVVREADWARIRIVFPPAIFFTAFMLGIALFYLNSADGFHTTRLATWLFLVAYGAALVGGIVIYWRYERSK